MADGTFCFRVAKIGFFVEDLSVQITEVYDIIVYKAEVSHSGAGEVEGDGATETAHSYNEDTGIL